MDEVEWLTRALMLEFRGGYDLDENASPGESAHWSRYRQAARNIEARRAHENREQSVDSGPKQLERMGFPSP